MPVEVSVVENVKSWLPALNHLTGVLLIIFFGQLALKSAIFREGFGLQGQPEGLKVLSQRRILPFLPFKKCYFWINVSGSFPGPVYIHQQIQASTQLMFEGGGPYKYLFNHVHTYHYFCHKALQSLHLPFRCPNIGDHLNSLIACYNNWSVNL